MADPNVAFAVAQLRDWLAEAQAEGAALGDEGGPSVPARDCIAPADANVVEHQAAAPGLGRLLAEFTALRHELKLSTKNGRAMFDQAAASIEALDRAIAGLESVAPQEERAARTASEPWAQAAAELDESLERAGAEFDSLAKRIVRVGKTDLVAALEAEFHSLSWWRRWAAAPFYLAAKKALADVWGAESQGAGSPGAPSPGAVASLPRLLQALAEGLQMIRDRLSRAMQRERLERIATVGRPVDPELMLVASVVVDSDAPPGTVVRELRRGYLYRGRLLRCAEVQAAAAPIQSPSTES